MNYKFIFSGHESFQCRQLWLKKGFDFVKSGNSFNSDDAVLKLGVGKNMVSSIRFWLKAFNITDKLDNITEFGLKMFDDDGWDPYLEDENSLWLLHYQLVKINYSSIYNLVFNYLRFEKTRFNKGNYLHFINRIIQENSSIKLSEKTIAEDFSVFVKLYTNHSFNYKELEDNNSSLLSDLNLVINYGSKKDELLGIDNDLRDSIDSSVFLYSILDNIEFGDSINLNQLEYGLNSIGNIFCINKTGIQNKIDKIVNKHRYLTFNNQAGIREIQFKQKPSPLSILDEYYA